MRLSVALAVVAASAVLAGPLLAADDPIEARQDIMQNNQDAAKIAFDMAQGRTPFDAAKAAAAMKTLQDDMTELITLFPPGSDKGDTAAMPAVFTNFEDFKVKAAKLSADAKISEQAAAKGLDAFKATLNAVGQDCQSCHDLYRKKRN
jgi:cytochrome c556